METTRADSAGITVSTSYVPARTWEDVTDGTTLVAALYPDDYPLGMVTQAVRLSDGRVVFIDRQAAAVKVFRPGEGVETMARTGQGPGEVLFPVGLTRLPGDSIQLFDRRQARVSVFGRDGRLAYEVPVPTEGGQLPTWVYRLQDAMLVGLYPMHQELREVARGESAFLRLLPYSVIVFTLDGPGGTRIATLPGTHDLVRQDGTSQPPAYGWRTAFTVLQNGLMAYGNGEEPSVTVIDRAGGTTRIHRLDLPRRPVSRDSIGLLIVGADELVLQRLGLRSIDDHPALDPALLPETLPAYKEIRSFGGGEVWLGAGGPFAIAPSRWSVISKDGDWLADLRLPEGAALLDVSGEYVVLRRTGALGEHYLEVWQVPELPWG